MNYIYFLLFLSAFSYCSCSIVSISGEEKFSNRQMVKNRTSLSDLPSDIIQLIIEYTEDPTTLRNVNRRLREKIVLKKIFQQFFDIAGLNHVDDNENELNYVLELIWTKNNPYLFFSALMEQIGGRKKPYKVIFRPLVLHLVKMFTAFDAQTQQEYQAYLIKNHYVSVERLLANRCIENGHYDLLFDFFGDKEALRDFGSKFKDRKVVIELFRANPYYARQYLDVIRSDSESLESLLKIWTVECIIGNLPREYYIDLFAPNSISWKLGLILNIILSANVPDIENQRIYSQIVELLDNHLGESVNSPWFLNLRLINDIRYGSFNLNEYKSLNHGFIDKHFQLRIAKASLLANKKDFFNYVVKNYELKLEDIVKEIEDLNVNSFQAKNFKYIFELIQDNSKCYFVNSSLLFFIMKFYAIKNFKFENHIVTFEFEVVENLLEYEFPPFIQIRQEFPFVRDFIRDIFVYMKVFTESIDNSFLLDMLKCNAREITVSYEFIEFISEYPNLLMLLIRNRFKFDVKTDIEFYEKYFNLPNFHLTRQIIKFDTSFILLIPKLNSKDHLKKLEWICWYGSIPINFLNWEPNLIEDANPKLIYLKWNLVFNYWIKGHEKESLKRIKTPAIIKMLRLQFPVEMNTLLGPE